MPKEFYTEKDIEDLFQRGVPSLRVTDQVILTELAYEKAKRLGLELITDLPDNPPAAPVRPYISQPQTSRPVQTIGPLAPAEPRPESSLTSGDGQNEIEKRIRSAVIARLGNQVETELLDNIIHRVVKSVGLK